MLHKHNCIVFEARLNYFIIILFLLFIFWSLKLRIAKPGHWRGASWTGTPNPVFLLLEVVKYDSLLVITQTLSLRYLVGLEKPLALLAPAEKNKTVKSVPQQSASKCRPFFLEKKRFDKNNWISLCNTTWFFFSFHFLFFYAVITLHTPFTTPGLTDLFFHLLNGTSQWLFNMLNGSYYLFPLLSFGMQLVFNDHGLFDTHLHWQQP